MEVWLASQVSGLSIGLVDLMMVFDEISVFPFVVFIRIFALEQKHAGWSWKVC